MSPFVKYPLSALLVASAVAAARPEVQLPAMPELPDATIRITGNVVAFIVGYEWAHGTLTYQGHSYPFRVRGMSIMDVAAAKIEGTGEVFNLKSLGDFEGSYVGSTFGSALSRGASVALFRNASGVTIRARSTVSGVRLNFSGNRFRIRFADPINRLGGSASGGAAPSSMPDSRG